MAKFLEENAKDAPVKDVLWEAQQLQTESVQIIDPGIGKEKIIRSYFFKAMELPKGAPKPTKLVIIESYKRLIGNMLWADGLEPVYDAPIQLYTKSEARKFPQVRAKMLKEKADFVIMIQCEARRGQSILETAQIAK